MCLPRAKSVSDNNHRSKSSSKRLGGQNMKNVIIVCGLNGAGKSTLGKALAEKLNYQFIDIEDIYFPKDNPEYMYLNRYAHTAFPCQISYQWI